MNNNRNQPLYRFKRFLRKFFLSAFVILTFAAYALHKPFTSANGNIGLAANTPSPSISQPAYTSTPVDPATAAGSQPGQTSTDAATAPQSFPSPTALPPTATAVQTASQFKNGNFTGNEIDAFFGLVQVQISIQNGKITNVQVPEYPSDRRTSVRINTFAVPILQQEAIQAQQANVDIVTGATLTSQAFAMSLQSALDKAKN